MRLILLMLLVCGPGFAHQKKEAVTRVIFNQRTRLHRSDPPLSAPHDAEHARQADFRRQGRTSSAASRPKRTFPKYIMGPFQNGRTAAGRGIHPENRGATRWKADTSGSIRKPPIPKDIEGLQVIHNALRRDIWPKQVNLVNIERRKKIKSLLFAGQVGALEVRFGDAED